MSTSLVWLCQAIRSEIRSLPEIAAVPDLVLDQATGEWPIVLVVPPRGTWMLGPHASANGHAMIDAAHTIHIEVHVPRADLPAAIDALLPLADAIPDALFAAFDRDRFNDAVLLLGDRAGTSANRPMSYELQPSQWGSDATLAYMFDIDILIQREVLIG